MILRLAGSTVAITGGAGLIGSFLVDEWVAKRARVMVIDNFSKGLRQNIAHHRPKTELREGDLEKPHFALAALSGSTPSKLAPS